MEGKTEILRDVRLLFPLRLAVLRSSCPLRPLAISTSQFRKLGIPLPRIRDKEFDNRTSDNS